MRDASRERAYVYRAAGRRRLVRAVDALGDALRGSARARARRPLPREVRRILVVKLDHIGDLVLALPAIEALSRAHPRARVDALVAPAAAPLLGIAALPLARVEALEPTWLDGRGLRAAEVARLARRLARERYDLAVDLRGDPVAILLARAAARSVAGIGHAGLGFLLDREHAGWRGGHQAALLLEVAALAGAGAAARALARGGDPRPRLVPGEAERARAASLLAPLGERAVAFHLGAGDARKIYPPERHAEVAAALAASAPGAAVVVVGSGADRPLAERFLAALGGRARALDLAGQLSLVESVAVLERCGALVGNDAGPAHLAAATGAAVVVAHAPLNDPARWRPLGERVAVVLPGAGEALEALPPARLVAAAQALFGGAPSTAAR